MSGRRASAPTRASRRPSDRAARWARRREASGLTGTARLSVMSVAVALVVGAGAAGATGAFTPDPPPPAQKAPAAQPALAQAVPAGAVVAQVASASVQGLASGGEVTDSAANPLTLTCDLGDGPRPVVSAARKVTAADGAQMTITVSAYSAGQGPRALSRVLERAPACSRARQGSFSSTAAPGPGPFATAARFSLGGAGAQALVWRRGDVAFYLAGSGDLGAIAAGYDQVATTALAPVCANVDSTPADATRSPWIERESYAGRTAARTVTVPGPGHPPPAPAGGAPPATAPDLAGQVVERPQRPGSYPLWPPLPAEDQRPTITAPTPAPTTAEVNEQIADKVGPGCGWAFTDTAQPVFDPAQARAAFATEADMSKAALSAQVEAYRQARAQYYRDWPVYVGAAKNYGSYRERVAEVARAWEKIAGDWRAYRSAKAAYDGAVAERDAFVSRQNSARTAYQQGLEACQAPPTTRTVTPSPTTTTVQPPPVVVPVAPSPSPTSAPPEPDPEQGEREPSPSPSFTTITPSPTTTTTTPAPITTTVPPPSCPARPAVLDQAGPTVGPAPSPPPDPRPVGQRG